MLVTIVSGVIVKIPLAVVITIPKIKNTIVAFFITYPPRIIVTVRTEYLTDLLDFRFFILDLINKNI